MQHQLFRRPADFIGLLFCFEFKLEFLRSLVVLGGSTHDTICEQAKASPVDRIYSIGEAAASGALALQEHGFFVLRGLVSARLAKRGVAAIVDRVKEGLGGHGVFSTDKRV